jgi:inner membrane protein
LASAPTHALIGAAIGLVAAGWLEPETRLRRWLPGLCALAAVLPDADVILHAWVAYSHPFGHRGAFHSLGFYLLLAVACATLAGRRARGDLVGAAVFCALLSHSLLDMLTDGGLGIALFWPLDAERRFLPWRPIPVSPIRIGRFFGAWGLRVLRVELLFALPLLFGALVLRAALDRRARRA